VSLAIKIETPIGQTDALRHGHYSSMRRSLLALLGLALGCGRSDLSGDILGGPMSVNTDTASDAGTSGWNDDASLIIAIGDDAQTTPQFPGAPSPPPGSFPDGGYFPDAACSPANCRSGCCNADGFCVDPPTADSCGGHGSSCRSCGGGMCFGTAGCVLNQATCEQSNCGGCCIGSSRNIIGCFEGTFGIMCGHGAGPCTVCAPNEVCRPLGVGRGGYCQANTVCDPTNCAGCCVENICATGDQNQACGYGGVACALCGAGGTCVSNQCVFGGPRVIDGGD
jgi:hypothetical protein